MLVNIIFINYHFSICPSSQSVDYRENFVKRGLRNASSIRYRFFGSVATEIQRNTWFSTLNLDDISYFKEILGEKNVIQDPDVLLDANTDWMRKYKGSSKLMLQPRTTSEV